MDDEAINYTQGAAATAVAHGSWYRGEHCNWIASRENLAEPAALEKYVLHGWLPLAPFITKQDYITPFGSCFAGHIIAWLQQRGYQVCHNKLGTSHVVNCGEGIVNTFALRQQFDWAYRGKQFNEDLWYDSKGELAAATEEIRQATREVFEQTTVFIITLGLSEIWCNRLTEEVFWRAIPKSKFDPSIHGFRVATYDENLENLDSIYFLLGVFRPTAKIVFTLSPIPLVATFRPVSCMTANSASKAILRAALDTFMQRRGDAGRAFYWPSYEIVKDFLPALGIDPYQRDGRHVRQEHLDMIMSAFERYYCAYDD